MEVCIIMLSLCVGGSKSIVIEMIKKKFSKDFMVKESFVWINPSARSIHW